MSLHGFWLTIEEGHAVWFAYSSIKLATFGDNIAVVKFYNDETISVEGNAFLELARALNRVSSNCHYIREPEYEITEAAGMPRSTPVEEFQDIGF